MTTLEAMASGCLCAGFTGIGGDEYATPDNGFWAPEDDCEAAADALAEAAAVAAEGGAELARRLEAGFETARAWSYAVFLQRLETVWMGIAPEARTRTPATVP
jgi:glycosyltransferase involved in cell wall biosynthesis